jgi:hypothetical protein
MDKMFSKSMFNQDISNWNMSSVKEISQMFSFSAFNQNVSKWNIKVAYGHKRDVFEGSLCTYQENILWLK